MTDGQEAAYLRRADEDLAAAQLLVANELYDSAVSRAYYVMFYAATAMMLAKGKQFKKHSGLLAAFAVDWVQSGAVEPEYQRFLNNAFDVRNKADYDLAQPTTRAAAETQVVRAQAFLNMARRVLG